MGIEVIPVMGDPGLENAFASLGIDFSNRTSMRQPKFRQAERDLLSPTLNIFAKRGVSKFWIARKGKRILGRIGAMVDREIFSHSETEKIGFIGLYEAESDVELAALLISTAIEYLKHEGCKSVWGPVDFSIYLGYRYQTDQFDSKCYVGEPRNPKYYVEHFLANGFKPSQSWQSHQISLDMTDKLMQKLEPDFRQSLNLGYRFESFELHGPIAALELLWELMQKTYTRMPGFIHLNLEDFKHQFSTMILMTDLTSSMFLIDPDSRPIGFNVVFQDKVEAIRAMRGSTSWWAKLKFKLNENNGYLANCYQIGIEYGAIKSAVVRGLRSNKRALSVAKALYHCSGIQIRKNPKYKEVIVALLRSDTPNIHITREFSFQIRNYALYARDI